MRRIKFALKTFFIASLTLFSPLFLTSVSAEIPKIFISELMADTPVSYDKDEWIEIYNYGDTEVDLDGWKLDAAEIGFIKITPNDFLIFTKSKSTFLESYTSIDSDKVVELGISLPNTSDSIVLENSLGEEIDVLSYPTTDASVIEGKSIESVGPNRSCDADLVTHADSHTAGGENDAYILECWTEETPTSYPTGPGETVINSVTISFCLEDCYDGENYKEENWFESIEAVGETELELRYELNYTGPEPVVNSETWTIDGESFTSLNNVINKTIDLVLEFTDIGEKTFSSQPINIYPKLKLNEFMPDPIGEDIDEEWVEIYNSNDFLVSLDHYQISSSSQPEKLNVKDYILNTDKCISGEGVKPNSFCLFYFPNESLVNSGDTINLFAGDIQEPLDSVTYEHSIEGQSFSFYENDWWTDLAITPGELNKLADHTTLQISEIYPSLNTGEEEWVELYNYGDSPINLEGWYLRDLSSTFAYLSSIVVNPEDYIVIDKTAFRFAMNDSGDTVKLYNPNDELIDEVSYNSSSKGYSCAHEWESDGTYSSEFYEKAIPTPGEVNQFPIGASLNVSILFSLDNKNWKNSVEATGETSVYFSYSTDPKDGFTIDSEKWYLEDGTEIEENPVILSDYENKSITLALIIDGEELEIESSLIKIHPEPIYTTLQISEVYPAPESGEEEWIELYNYGSKKINLDDWKIGDKSSTKSLSGLSIGSKKYLVISQPKLGISLNNSGDTVSLYSPEEKLVDKVSYDEVEKGTALARKLDGNKYKGGLKDTTTKTPGKKNRFTAESAKDSTESAEKAEGKISAISTVNSSRVLGESTKSSVASYAVSLEMFDLVDKAELGNLDLTWIYIFMFVCLLGILLCSIILIRIKGWDKKIWKRLKNLGKSLLRKYVEFRKSLEEEISLSSSKPERLGDRYDEIV